MPTTIVDEFYNDYRLLLALLEDKKDASLISSMNEKFRRLLILVSANHFENEIRGVLLNLYQTKSTSPLLAAFAEKSNERRYDEYFDWEAKNANRFFALFGREFRDGCQEEVGEDDRLDDGIKAFLFIGNTRNELIHKQLFRLPFEKTTDEVYGEYKKALLFLDYIRTKLG